MHYERREGQSDSATRRSGNEAPSIIATNTRLTAYIEMTEDQGQAANHGGGVSIAWVSRTGSEKIGLMGTAKPNQQDLLFVKTLLEVGKVVPVIDRRYPLRETAEAIRYLEAGHAQGKVIITVEQNNKS